MFDMIHNRSVCWEVYRSISDLQFFFLLFWDKRYSGSFHFAFALTTKMLLPIRTLPLYMLLPSSPMHQKLRTFPRLSRAQIGTAACMITRIYIILLFL